MDPLYVLVDQHNVLTLEKIDNNMSVVLVFRSIDHAKSYVRERIKPEFAHHFRVEVFSLSMYDVVRDWASKSNVVVLIKLS